MDDKMITALQQASVLSDYGRLQNRVVELRAELESARRALRAEADRADLICYKVRDLLQARAYNEAAAYCAEKLSGR